MNDSAEVIDSTVLAPPRRLPRSHRLSVSRKHILLSAGGCVLLVAAIMFGDRWWTIGRFMESTNDAYVGGDVTEISPHVSGFVTTILVSDNQRVTAGQELIRIDAADFAAVQDHAAATVQQRQATLANLQAQTALQRSLIDARRMDLRWLMMFGLATFGVAMWSYSFITHDWSGDQLLLPQVLRGFPQVFAVAPAVTLGLGSLPPARLKYASGLFNMMRNLGGAVGIALCGAILNSKTNVHFLDIASTLTPANGASQHLISSMSSKLGDLLGSTTAGYAAALQQLRALAYREASTLAYADAFRAMMIVCLGAACLVPLLRNIVNPPAPSADAH